MQGGNQGTMDFVIANGRREDVRLPCTVEAFLVARGLPPKTVVVEHNGEPVLHWEFASRALASGDRLEVVRIVAGG